MRHTVRTFVAVEIGAENRQAAGRLIQSLRGAGADVKWVAPENLHLTLKFLGDVPNERLAEVCRAVEQAAGAQAPFVLELRGAGAFPNAARPRVIWLGTGEGTEPSISLAEAVEQALEGLGFRREARRFHPHLTLGRMRRSGPGVSALARLLKEHAEFDAGRAEINQTVVFSSQLTRSGPVYEPLAHARLGGA